MVKTSDYLVLNKEINFTDLLKCSFQVPKGTNNAKQSRCKLIMYPFIYI